jgi:hypothetical protein
MLAFQSMIAKAATDAGMKVPPEDQLDVFDDTMNTVWTIEDYPHFGIFCHLQLARSMSSPNQHWENAKVIAAIPEEQLKTMLIQDFVAAGVDIT